MISLRSFIAGFLTLAVLHVFVTCSEGDSGTQPSPQPTVNVEKIHHSQICYYTRVKCHFYPDKI